MSKMKTTSAIVVSLPDRDKPLSGKKLKKQLRKMRKEFNKRIKGTGINVVVVPSGTRIESLVLQSSDE
jgi:biotin operon repressor